MADVCTMAGGRASGASGLGVNNCTASCKWEPMGYQRGFKLLPV